MKVKLINKQLRITHFPYFWALISPILFVAVVGWPLEDEFFILSGDGIFKILTYLILVAVSFYFLLQILVYSKFEFDEKLQQLSWNYINLFGSKSGKVSFSHIKDVIIKTVGSKLQHSRKIEYQIIILLESGITLPLAKAYSLEKEKCLALQNQILDVLSKVEIPDEKYQLEKTIQYLLQQNRKIDAIILIRERKNYSLKQAKSYLQDLDK